MREDRKEGEGKKGRYRKTEEGKQEDRKWNKTEVNKQTKILEKTEG